VRSAPRVSRSSNPPNYAREKRWAEQVVPTLFSGEAVWLEAPRTEKFLGIYTEAKDAKGAIILAHGLGVHPDYGVIGELRARLAEAGYTTLSVQMPILAAEAPATRYRCSLGGRRALCGCDELSAPQALRQDLGPFAQHGLAHGEPLHQRASTGSARGLDLALDLERRPGPVQAHQSFPCSTSTPRTTSRP